VGDRGAPKDVKALGLEDSSFSVDPKSYYEK
jgi:hypothetical protein